MAKSIIINAKASVIRAAVIEERRLDNLFIDNQNEKSSIKGNLYLGRIDSIIPSIQAAFIDIGTGKNGFIHLDDFIHHGDESDYSEKSYREGERVLVQVAKDEIGTKGVRLVTEVSLPGRFLVLMPYGKGRIRISRKITDEEDRQFIKDNIASKLNIPDNMDLIIRTAASGVKIRFIKRDLEHLLKSWKELNKKLEQDSESIRCVHEELDLIRKIVRDWLDESVQTIYIDDKSYFDSLKQFIKTHFAKPNVKLRQYKESVNIFYKFGITKQLEKLYNKKVWLRCGGYIVIDKTEALVAIDVNTGRNVKHSSSKDTILETNIEAAEEIARQLRLRNMGGIVIVDFIDMKSKSHQREVLKTITSNLERDKAKTKTFPFTKLGLLQITRQRVEESWEQHYFVNCDRCGGTGRILSVSIICEQLLNQIKRYLFEHPGLNLNVRANSSIIDSLMEKNSFQEIENQYQIEIGYLKDESYHPENYIVIRTDNGKNIVRHDI